jgi:hypothetical protein
VTYLAFPLAADAIAFFGDGYAVNVLVSVDWLGALDLTYWGDVDTHWFAILNRLRSRFPQARSILMDRGTLLAHQSQWVIEATPTKAALGPHGQLRAWRLAFPYRAIYFASYAKVFAAAAAATASVQVAG